MPSREEITAREQKVTEQLHGQPPVRAGTVAEWLGMGADAAGHLLRRMEREHKVERIGSGPNTRWAEPGSRDTPTDAPALEHQSSPNGVARIADPARSIAARALLNQLEVDTEGFNDKLKEWQQDGREVTMRDARDNLRAALNCLDALAVIGPPTAKG